MASKLIGMLAMIFVIPIMIWCIVENIRDSRRQAPYGKVFKRDFLEAVDDIVRAMRHNKLEYITAFVSGNYQFKVKAIEEENREGLDYPSLQIYRSHAIYINDELVCRVHLFGRWSNQDIFVEFSSKRNMDEVIDIVNKAHTQAKQYIKEEVSEWFGKSDSKSFYSSTRV